MCRHKQLGAGAEGETDSSLSGESNSGLTPRTPRDYDLGQSQTLNRLSHQALQYFIIIIFKKYE